MTIAEQIKSFESKRSANDAARLDIMNKAAEEAHTLDQEESENYDNLTAEIKSVDAHLSRLREIQDTQIKTAKPVDNTQKSILDAARSRSGIVNGKGW
ncbi:hypothetical protein [Arsenophonus endosymbiont of Aleurodicus floccissimus]|uniref:hypothetical protein n=1 Tax=Arsenophonus endosymbiont of Aleurodicus floccissimus TaxID=2152761 RepID=UPI000E6B02CA|nr:hypothetical protein [Arsenophonus endosymbiont of Aleurodicus floccissimus]